MHRVPDRVHWHCFSFHRSHLRCKLPRWCRSYISDQQFSGMFFQTKLRLYGNRWTVFARHRWYLRKQSPGLVLRLIHLYLPGSTDHQPYSHLFLIRITKMFYWFVLQHAFGDGDVPVWACTLLCNRVAKNKTFLFRLWSIEMISIPITQWKYNDENLVYAEYVEQAWWMNWVK